MFAIGGNKEAAAVSGVNITKNIMGVYLVAGVLYGLAAFLEAGRIQSVNTGTGLNYDLDAISGCVIGGVSFNGGVGTIPGVVLGVVLLQVINYSFNFLGINPYSVSYTHLLKPVNSEELGEILQRIREKRDKYLEQQRDIRILRENYRKNFPILKEKFLNDWMEEKIVKEEFYEKLEEYVPEIRDSDRWIVAMFCIEREELSLIHIFFSQVYNKKRGNTTFVC